MAKSILIRGARVVTVDDKQTVGRFDLRLEGSRIAAMGDNLSERGVDEVVAAEGMVVMPGLVQAHMHLCQTLFRSLADDVELLTWLRERIWPLEAALEAEDLRAAARLGMAELLLGGTTSILDMGTVHHTDVLFEAAVQLGLRYTGGKTIMDHGQAFPARLRETAEDAVAQSVALCKRWHNTHDGRLRYAFSPRFVISCTDAALSGCVREARAHGALLHTHASENTEEVALVRERTGRGNVEHLHALGFSGSDVLLAHGIWLSAEEQRLLRETRTRIVHCPSSNLKLASGIARLTELLEAGIDVALGADGAACANGLDGFMEMRLAALLHKVRGGPTAVPAPQALYLATRGGALAMGMPDCGSIAVGQRADLILLDIHKPHLWPDISDLTSRLVYTARPSDVHTVFVHGRKVVEAGRLLSADTGQIMDDAQAAAVRVRDRAGLV